MSSHCQREIQFGRDETVFYHGHGRGGDRGPCLYLFPCHDPSHGLCLFPFPGNDRDRDLFHDPGVESLDLYPVRRRDDWCGLCRIGRSCWSSPGPR